MLVPASNNKFWLLESILPVANGINALALSIAIKPFTSSSYLKNVSGSEPRSIFIPALLSVIPAPVSPLLSVIILSSISNWAVLTVV